MLVPPGVKTFFFKLHTGTLTIKTWMEEKGLFVPWGTHCFLCKRPETVEHVFLECWNGVFLWDVLQRTLKKDFPLDPYGIRFCRSTMKGEFLLTVLCSCVCTASGGHELPCVTLTLMCAKHKTTFVSVISFVEAHKVHQCIPDWLPLIEGLVTMKIL